MQARFAVDLLGLLQASKGLHKAYVNRSEYREFIRKASPEKLAKVLRVLAILTQTKVYLLWKNGHFKRKRH